MRHLTLPRVVALLLIFDNDLTCTYKHASGELCDADGKQSSYTDLISVWKVLLGWGQVGK